MTNKNTLTALIVALSLLFVGCGRLTPRGAAAFGQFDADGDGLVSKKELTEAMAGRRGDPERLFSRLDTDGDGYISEKEFEARPRSLAR